MPAFAFRPRYRGLAWGSIGVGGAVGSAAVALGLAAVPLASGVLGVALGAVYLLSPTWKLSVVTDDAGLEVRGHKGTRFQLAWSEIRRVVASPSTRTCFIDGGAPERSVLVPGVGAPAPYAIANREQLYDIVIANVPADRVETVETLEGAEAATKAKARS